MTEDPTVVEVHVEDHEVLDRPTVVVNWCEVRDHDREDVFPDYLRARTSTQTPVSLRP